MAGLAPAMTVTGAKPCIPERDQDEPGDDA